MVKKRDFRSEKIRIIQKNLNIQFWFFVLRYKKVFLVQNQELPLKNLFCQTTFKKRFLSVHSCIVTAQN
jgi:hypothetical protein